MKSNWIRFLAGVIASAVLVGAFALTGGMKNGKRTDGLLYQASGLHPDGELLLIDGQTVTAEEYLYWLAQDCDYLSGQVEGLDWDAAVTEDMTFGAYAKADAMEAVKQHAVVRAWAEEAGIGLTDADKAELEAQRQQYVMYYGSEESFLQRLAVMGVSEAAWDMIQTGQYLYRNLYEAFCTPSSGLYPDEASLADYAAAQGYMSVYAVTVTDDDAEGVAADLLARWQAAEDKEKEYALICEELQQTADGIVTLTAVEDEYAAICEELGQEAGSAVTLAAVEDDPLSDAIAALEEGGMDAVIDPYEDGTCYVVMRTETDMSAVAQTYFDVLWEQRVQDAVVVVNTKLYDPIDTGAFYEKLVALRSEAAQEPAQAQQ